MSTYSYGARIDNDSNAITTIDETENTAVTVGYVNGEYVEFSGGGSDDFSIAEVTISASSEYAAGLTMALIEEDFGVIGATLFDTLEGVVFQIPLYQGHSWIFASSYDNVACTGDIVWDSENGGFDVTGDGTITMSA